MAYRYIKKNPFTRRKGRRYVRKKRSAVASLKKRVKKLEVSNTKSVSVYEVTEAGLDIFTTPGVIELQSNTLDAAYHFLSFQMKGVLQVDVEDVDVNHLCRIVVVIDRENHDSSTDPVWTDVFKTADVFSLRAYDPGTTGVQNRFKIIFDKTYYVSKVSNGFNKEKVLVECYKKLDIIKLTDGTGATKNGLWLMYMSTGATGDIDFAMQTRLRYTIDD